MGKPTTTRLNAASIKWIGKSKMHPINLKLPHNTGICIPTVSSPIKLFFHIDVFLFFQFGATNPGRTFFRQAGQSSPI